MGDSMRGQAAIEYLITYGWAFLVIVVVISILFFLTQGMFKVELCNFQPIGFSCGDSLPQIYAEGSNNAVSIAIRVYNQLGQPVNIKSVACTTVSPTEVTDSAKQSPGVTRINAGSSVVLNTKCFDATGKQLSLPPGSQFKGYYIIWYNFDTDPDQSVQKQAVATVAGQVLKKS